MKKYKIGMYGGKFLPLHKGHHFYSREYCECLEGIYLTKYNKLVEYYARM